MKNPILKGFNPDPSICRVGDDYFIATSTFEWFPGVQIHHSRDLVNWKLVVRPLDRLSQLDMHGNPPSGGVWAPCLTYDGNLYYLVYTNVRNWKEQGGKVTHNYIVTAPSITGPWSDPIYINSSGFDPSLFHDDDGRKWLSNMTWDYRKGRNRFAGIVLQEYDPKAKKLVGPVKNIFKGTKIGLTEGPHVYKRNGYYYLMVAEGGTGYNHAVSMARSRDIRGPYEVHPENPILTSINNPGLTLQKAGHGSIIEEKDGTVWLVHLCGRPLSERGRCILGRETALQKFKWCDDGWLRLASGGNEPRDEIPELPDAIEQKEFNYDFSKKELPIDFQSLRTPMSEDWVSLKANPGYLRISGREALNSRFRQSIVARRVTSFQCEFETMLKYNPGNIQQCAGLIMRYDESSQFYCYVTFSDELNSRVIDVICFQQGEFDMPIAQIPVPAEAEHIRLRSVVNREKLNFLYSFDGQSWKMIERDFDMSMLSDEMAFPPGFTGAFGGMACQDMSGGMFPCDFKYFKYTVTD